MSKSIDLTGNKFNRWTVLERAMPNSKHRLARWVCKCDCGAMRIVLGGGLRSGASKSCGCYRIERTTKHGESRITNGHPSKEWVAWGHMKSRCLNLNDPYYKDYGGRGITICDRWLSSYVNFLEDMGRCPKNLTLERINNNGNYEPTNCKWATMREQNRNSRNNVWITAPNGERKILADWAKKLGVSNTNWTYWRKKGFTNEEILNRFIDKQREQIKEGRG